MSVKGTANCERITPLLAEPVEKGLQMLVSSEDFHQGSFFHCCWIGKVHMPVVCMALVSGQSKVSC